MAAASVTTTACDRQLDQGIVLVGRCDGAVALCLFVKRVTASLPRYDDGRHRKVQARCGRDRERIHFGSHHAVPQAEVRTVSKGWGRDDSQEEMQSAFDRWSDAAKAVADEIFLRFFYSQRFCRTRYWRRFFNRPGLSFPIGLEQRHCARKACSTPR